MFIPHASELFRLTDNGSGGSLQTLKREWKMRLRAWWGRSSLQEVARTLAHPELASLIAIDPQLLLRPLRSYLWTGLDASNRARAFSAHFAWLRRTFDEADIDTLYHNGSLSVGTMPLSSGTLEVTLTPGIGLGREGELELHLNLDGQVLLRAAFCVLPSGLLGANASTLGHHVMVIGCVQGSAGMADAMKTLTQATHRSRPKALLMDVLQGLRAGWKIDAIAGVSTRAHVYGGYRSRARHVAFDYDAMWRDLGAAQPLESHWVLPNAPLLRGDSEVASRKRAENRRRCEFRSALHAMSCDWAASIAAQPLHR